VKEQLLAACEAANYWLQAELKRPGVRRRHQRCQFTVPQYLPVRPGRHWVRDKGPSPYNEEIRLPSPFSSVSAGLL
jgi:hypothetical protein